MKSSGYLKEQNMTKAMPPSGREKGQTKKKKKKKESSLRIDCPIVGARTSPWLFALLDSHFCL